MAGHDEGVQGMDNLNLGERSIANQGNIHISNSHYYSSSSLSLAPSQEYVCGLPRDPNRVKRLGLLEKLKRMLPEGEKHEPVALWGLAGSGKSRLALHYAKERFRRRGCSVFWIHAHDEATFVSDFKMIARKSKGIVDMSSDVKDLLLDVKEWIESQPAWGLIIDGADDVEFFSTGDNTDSFNPLECIPDSEGYNGTIIWTSQDRGILNLNDLGRTRGLKVGCMTPDEAVLLLQNAANHGESFNNPNAAIKLVQELDFNPLIISHIANTMRDQSILPEEMLSHLKDPRRRGNILGSPWINPNRPGDRNGNVFDVLGGQAKHLARRNAAAHRIIDMVASLQGHNAISLDMLFEADRPEENELTRRTITRLSDLSILYQDLAATGGSSYKIDRLVQEAILHCLDQRPSLPKRTSHSDTDKSQRSQSVLEAEIRPQSNSVNELLNKFPSKINYDTLSLCQPLVKEALNVFGNSQWMPPKSSTFSESTDLLIRLGDYLLFCGRWREMQTPYQKALEFRQKVWGEDHLQTLAAMDALAGVFSNLGYFQKAFDLFSKAHRIRVERLHLPETHRDVMAGNKNIAVAHQDLGRFQLAELLFADVLRLQVKTLGKEHVDTAQTMSAMGELCGVIGHRDKALKLLREATEITRRLLGNQDTKTLEMASALGFGLYAPQDLDESCKTLRDNLDTRHQLLGPRHPHTLKTKVYLGAILAMNSSTGKNGVKLLSGSAQRLHHLLGRSHPYTTAALGLLADQLRRKGEFAEAAAIRKDNLHEVSRLVGEMHPESLYNQVKLAEIYLDMSCVAESTALVTSVYHLKARSTDETLSRAYGPVFEDAERLWNQISRVLDSETSSKPSEVTLRRTFRHLRDRFG